MPEEVKYSHLQTPADVEKNSVSSGLPPSLRHEYEAQFGTDLSSVLIHEGHAATLKGGAQSFTTGDDIHFAPGAYDPYSQEGRQRLGHELTHVVQQREGRCGPASLTNAMILDGRQ
jgi:hypothetical protein